MKRASRPARSDYHHGDLRRALIEAALAALESQGWHELSLRDVARQAGVSHTAPYRHFESKEALLTTLAEVGHTELADAMEAAVRDAPDDPLGQLRGVGRAYVQLALRRPALFRLMFSGAICALEAQEADGGEVHSARSFDLLVQVVRDGQAGGKVRPGPPEQVAVTAWALVHGLSVLLLERQFGPVGDASPDPLALVDEVTRQLVEGLAVPPPTKKNRR